MENFKTSGVCSRNIQFEVENNIVKNVFFDGGCPGNTIGVAKLVQGKTVDEVISTLKGIDCRNRGTSCPDQLAKALEQYKNAK
ncbi:MAG: TIGR03905 family TSCPD domain-containing protein [Clostridia bacterium]|nr:TIGR03905 family TSCPD domain-containing protein [Clostridia bacterium]